ncbi:unnamed protein product [Adineta ricciae]|uniref:R3H domain-containing protein n=2 Tax=Adineta ricciae TaxID=249248 RepID=A0A814YET5_ADIRI|nr:unnamed protein product [Adineta ricciae]
MNTLGCYLTVDDDEFLDMITNELNKYNSVKKSTFILLFPSLPARHRLLLHRLRERDYSKLFSFSVGENRDTRRTIICFKSQLMEETTATPPSNETSTVSKAASSNSNDDSSSKRRPDQALYKPPRRSKNLEVTNSPTPPPLPPSSPAIATEDSQQSNDAPKPVKTKTPRPSLEPYRPPSRRSQPVAKEIVPVASTSTTEKKCEDSEEKKIVKDEQDEEEEDWEKLFDGNDNLVEEIQSRFKESVQIKKPVNDYSKWSIDDIVSKEADLAHIVEVSNFPSTFHTEDLSNAFKILTRSSFDIKWVDDTHALIVFPDAGAALEVLQLEHPMFKVCSMSQASVASKKKSKNAGEFLQPYKARPQTSSLTANRQICAALGVKTSMSSNKTKIERQKIESAKQQKIRDKEEQNAVWDGAVFPTTPTN